MPGKEEIKVVQRYDTVDSMNWITEPFKKTPEGFLRGRAIITNVGVFSYRTADGGIQLELRLPEEVFDRESLESLKLKPLANNHPDEDITAENIKKYQVGNVGDNPGSETQRDWAGYDTTKMTDGFHLAVDLIVQEAEAITNVLDGKVSLSCGYKCDLEDTAGIWCGMPYDKIQRRIRYNHVALVDAARAGDAARIRLDGNDAILVDNIKTNRGGATMPAELKTVKLDGVDYQAEAEVIKQLTLKADGMATMEKHLANVKEEHSKTLAAHDSLKDKCDKLQSANDALKEAHDALKAKIKGAEEEEPDEDDSEDPAEKGDPEKEKKGKKASEGDSADDFDLSAIIRKRVDARITLLRAAEKAGVEDAGKMKSSDLKKQVILKVHPNSKLDGKDKTYINARFDLALEALPEMTHNDSVTRALGGAVIPTGSDQIKKDSQGKDVPDSKKARKDMIDRLVNKGSESEKEVK